MEKSNVIISIIIVICVAAGVTAYGLTNNADGNLFTNLQGIDGGGDSGNSIGNSSDIGSTDSPSGGSGSSSGSGSGSGTGSGTGSGSGVSNTPTKPAPRQGPKITQNEAKSIANKHILQAGCYAGTPRLVNNDWYVPVLDSNGNTVDTIVVDGKTGFTSRG